MRPIDRVKATARALCPCGHDSCAAKLLARSLGEMVTDATFPSPPDELFESVSEEIGTASGLRYCQIAAAWGEPAKMH